MYIHIYKHINGYICVCRYKYINTCIYSFIYVYPSMPNPPADGAPRTAVALAAGPRSQAHAGTPKLNIYEYIYIYIYVYAHI